MSPARARLGEDGSDMNVGSIEIENVLANPILSGITSSIPLNEKLPGEETNGEANKKLTLPSSIDIVLGAVADATDAELK